MSVTSSRRSSISSTISTTSGWFSVIAFAIFCSRIVLPARAATRSGRAALPDRRSRIDDPVSMRAP
jgi:hypothetical protein